jgi:hypothetical protein
MALQDLETQFQQLAGQNQLTLAAIAGQVGPFGAILDELPLDVSIVLGSVTCAMAGTGADERLTLGATINWELLHDAAFTCILQNDSSRPGAYLIGAQFQLPPSAQISIPGLTWFSLSGFSAAGQTLPHADFSTGLMPVATVSLGATLVIDGGSSQTPIPIKIESGAGSALHLSLNTSAVDLPSVNDILAAFGSAGSGIALPPGLNDLLHFSLQGLAVGFDPSAGTITDIRVSIANSDEEETGWAIVPGFLALDSYAIGLSILDPFGTRQIGGFISANLKLGTVDIAVGASHPAGGGWQFQGEIGAVTPVPIGSILSGLTHQFGVDLPDVLNEFTLSNFILAFDTGTLDASGQFTVDFTVGSTPVEIIATATLTRNGAAYDKVVTGELTVGAAVFDVTFSDQPGGKTFTALWSDTANPLEFADLASAFGFTLPEIPEGLDLALTGAGLLYDFSSGSLTVAATSKNFGQIAFVSEVRNAVPVYVFDIAVPLHIELSDIPVAGEQIPASLDAGIELLEITYATALLAPADLATVNANLATLHAKPLGPANIGEGMAFFVQLTLGTEHYPLLIPLQGAAPAQTAQGGSPAANAPAQTGAGGAPVTPATPTPPAPAPPTVPGKWFDVGKGFGPFTIDRVGVQYKNATLMFALDASLAFGPLTFSMQGLAIGSELSAFSPVFAISGLGIQYNKPPLEIVGAILKVPVDATSDVEFQFDGTLVLKAEELSLAAIGSYAQMKSGASSLFVFAQIETPLGGPPALFVTGLMAGFGFNRDLVIPGQDEVASFPLLTLATPPGPGQGAEPGEVLQYLEGTAALNGVQKAWIAPKAGEYWLAAGVEFTSFELVQTKAMLAVEFGDTLQIAVLGLSTMQLPKPELSSQTYAYVELMLRVVIQPDLGSVQATAILSKNSYVITPDCHLTGGFAFYLWYGSNPNAGQFVVTLGGYHPAFRVPASFPQVPRLGFNWAVSDNVTVKGNAYFALTTSCAMAGGGLEILFQDGDLRAWFTAQADFLVSWHPFFYIADISVSIGASYRINLLVCHKTITVSLGADLHMWGPPTGGTVHIDLCVVSFSVGFGSDSAGQQNDPLDWPGFTALLPDSATVCRIAVNDGLYKTADAPANSSGKLWVVRAQRFAFQTQSAIPASHLQYGSQAPVAAQAGGISIKPMNQTGVNSTHLLKVYEPGNADPADVSAWTLTPATRAMPDSLWGTPPSPFTQMPAQPAADVIDGQVSGYAVTAPPPQIGATRGVVALVLLQEEYLEPAGQSPLSTAVAPTSAYLPVFANDTVAQIASVMADPAKTGRAALFAALTGAQLFAGVDGDLSQLGTNAAHLYADVPMSQN